MLTYTTYSQKYEPTEDELREDWKKICLYGGTETIVWNRYSYQGPDLVGSNASTNENIKFYNSTVQEISRAVGDCATKVAVMCPLFC